jgi:hypothetical protein
MNSRLIYGRSSDPGRPNDMTNSWKKKISKSLS